MQAAQHRSEGGNDRRVSAEGYGLDGGVVVVVVVGGGSVFAQNRGLSSTEQQVSVNLEESETVGGWRKSVGLGVELRMDGRRARAQDEEVWVGH